MRQRQPLAVDFAKGMEKEEGQMSEESKTNKKGDKKKHNIPFCRCRKKKVLRRLSSQTARWIGLKEEWLALLWPGFLSSTAKQLSSEQDSLDGFGDGKESCRIFGKAFLSGNTTWWDVPRICPSQSLKNNAGALFSAGDFARMVFGNIRLFLPMVLLGRIRQSFSLKKGDFLDGEKAISAFCAR